MPLYNVHFITVKGHNVGTKIYILEGSAIKKRGRAHRPEASMAPNTHEWLDNAEGPWRSATVRAAPDSLAANLLAY